MSSRRKALEPEPPSMPETALPVVCIVTVDEEFLGILIPELAPWFEVIVGHSYEDLARSTREALAAAVLLDIDTEGEEPFGGLKVLNELRELNSDLTLISLSRARARSVEKQALNAGADAHFRNPVDPGIQPLSGLCGRERADAAGIRCHSASGRQQHQRTYPGRERDGQRAGGAGDCGAEPSGRQGLYPPELRGAA
jgi:CheY-like chemotaxis protein